MRPISMIVIAMLVLSLSPASADPDRAHAFLDRLPAPPANIPAAKARCGGTTDSETAPLQKELDDRMEDMRREAPAMSQQDAMAVSMAMQSMKPADINALMQFQQQGAQSMQLLVQRADELFKQPRAALDQKVAALGDEMMIEREPCMKPSAPASCFDNVMNKYNKNHGVLVQQYLRQMSVNWAEWINLAKDSLRTEARLLAPVRNSSNPALRFIALEQDARAWKLVQTSLNEAEGICSIGASPEVLETH